MACKRHRCFDYSSCFLCLLVHDLEGKKEMNMLEEEAKKRTNVMAAVVEWIKSILISIVIALLIVTYVGQRTIVIGSSMETTLSDGDNLIVDKLSYRFSEPERYDIVVFPYKYEKKNYVKRLIGLPGDTVQIKDGYVYINDALLSSDIYGAEVMHYANLAAEPMTLGDDEYFVLGDNRNHSSDSRNPLVGVLKQEDIIGKAWVRIYPFDKIGKLSRE